MCACISLMMAGTLQKFRGYFNHNAIMVLWLTHLHIMLFVFSTSGTEVINIKNVQNPSRNVED